MKYPEIFNILKIYVSNRSDLLPTGKKKRENNEKAICGEKSEAPVSASHVVPMSKGNTLLDESTLSDLPSGGLNMLYLIRIGSEATASVEANTQWNGGDESTSPRETEQCHPLEIAPKMKVPGENHYFSDDLLAGFDPEGRKDEFRYDYDGEIEYPDRRNKREAEYIGNDNSAMQQHGIFGIRCLG